MIWGMWLVVAVTALEWAASACYWYGNDWRHGLFWACAGIMNVVVTW